MKFLLEFLIILMSDYDLNMVLSFEVIFIISCNFCENSSKVFKSKKLRSFTMINCISNSEHEPSAIAKKSNILIY